MMAAPWWCLSLNWCLGRRGRVVWVQGELCARGWGELGVESTVIVVLLSCVSRVVTVVVALCVGYVVLKLKLNELVFVGVESA